MKKIRNFIGNVNYINESNHNLTASINWNNRKNLTNCNWQFYICNTYIAPWLSQSSFPFITSTFNWNSIQIVRILLQLHARVHPDGYAHNVQLFQTQRTLSLSIIVPGVIRPDDQWWVILMSHNWIQWRRNYLVDNVHCIYI